MELVILAGGIGSRFGGLKQLEPVDEFGNFIVDYLIFDAIRLGFSKVVFVIREECLNLFQNTICKRIKSKIEYSFAFQNNKNIPEKYIYISERQKPLGTAHALLCSHEKIKDDFVVANADDFYGRDALSAATNFLKNKPKIEDVGLVTFKAQNTLSNFGDVKRGVCEIKNNKIVNIVETKITKTNNNQLLLKPILSDGKSVVKSITSNVFVSMNLIAFNKNIFKFLREEFNNFLETNKNDLSSVEFFIPSFLTNTSNKNQISITPIKTDSIWKGLTFKDDLQDVKSHILNLKSRGEYPDRLWV